MASGSILHEGTVGLDESLSSNATIYYFGSVITVDAVRFSVSLGRLGTVFRSGTPLYNNAVNGCGSLNGADAVLT